MSEPAAALRDRLRAASALVLDLGGGLHVYGARRLTPADRDAIVAAAPRLRQQLAAEWASAADDDRALAIALQELAAAGDVEPVAATDGRWGTWRRRLADRETAVRRRMGLPTAFASGEALVAALADALRVPPEQITVRPTAPLEEERQ